jgi:hypothetical protein
MPAYPVGLPLPVQQGYALQHVSPMIRTEMQSGRARQRRAFTSVPSMVSVSWIFRTVFESRLFEGWFRDDLGAGDGANWFTMKLQTPLGIMDYECRFTGIYNGPQLIAFDKWQFSAELEIRDRPILAPGFATILPDYILMPDIFDSAMNQEWPAA